MYHFNSSSLLPRPILPGGRRYKKNRLISEPVLIPKIYRTKKTASEWATGVTPHPGPERPERPARFVSTFLPQGEKGRTRVSALLHAFGAGLRLRHRRLIHHLGVLDLVGVDGLAFSARCVRLGFGRAHSRR